MSFKRAAIPNNLMDRVDELEKRLADLTIDAVTPVPDPGGGDTTIIVNGKHVIQDEGTSLPARGNSNFVGAGVTATDDEASDATVVTIPGGEELPSASQIGQVLFSVNGSTFTAQTPLICEAGWMVEEKSGTLMVI